MSLSSTKTTNLMTSQVPVVQDTASITDVEVLLHDASQRFETINYIYVVDKFQVLLGVFSIKEFFRAPKAALVRDLMIKQLYTVHPHTDQERVAYLALKHSLKAVPVLSKERHFLGVVASDTILEILDSEAVENLLRFGGVMHTSRVDNIFTLNLFDSLKHRLPWLLLGLLGGLFASGVVGSFELVLAENLILAAFIPLVVYMASAVGIQMEAFIIRDLAVNPDLQFRQYFSHQFSVVAFIALVVALLFYGGAFVFYGHSSVYLVIALALFLAVMSSICTGLLIPFLFNKFKLDPANASGPIATILQDILSIVIYFSVASALL